MNKPSTPTTELHELISLFYPRMETLGEFKNAAASECPEAYRAMLAHSAHMTVTLERRHGSAVSVDVLESRTTDTHYLRKIILRRVSDQRVVQYGIVRLSLDALKAEVRDEIMAQQTPLGRVLINHNVLRQVQLNSVWRVHCGTELANLFELPNISQSPNDPVETFGRTALIYCDGEPAVELLEIVAPEDSF